MRAGARPPRPRPRCARRDEHVLERLVQIGAQADGALALRLALRGEPFGVGVEARPGVGEQLLLRSASSASRSFVASAARSRSRPVASRCDTCACVAVSASASDASELALAVAERASGAPLRCAAPPRRAARSNRPGRARACARALRRGRRPPCRRARAGVPARGDVRVRVRARASAHATRSDGAARERARREAAGGDRELAGMAVPQREHDPAAAAPPRTTGRRRTSSERGEEAQRRAASASAATPTATAKPISKPVVSDIAGIVRASADRAQQQRPGEQRHRAREQLQAGLRGAAPASDRSPSLRRAKRTSTESRCWARLVEEGERSHRDGLAADRPRRGEVRGQRGERAPREREPERRVHRPPKSSRL